MDAVQLVGMPVATCTTHSEVVVPAPIMRRFSGAGRVWLRAKWHVAVAAAAVQVLEAFQALRQHGVDVVTLGQYMRPTKRHMAVEEFVTPAAFAAYQQAAEQMGFLYVASGPMVRSSYRAGEFYLKNVLQARRSEAAAGGSSSSAAAAVA